MKIVGVSVAVSSLQQASGQDGFLLLLLCALHCSIVCIKASRDTVTECRFLLLIYFWGYVQGIGIAGLISWPN